MGERKKLGKGSFFSPFFLFSFFLPNKDPHPVQKGALPSGGHTYK